MQMITCKRCKKQFPRRSKNYSRDRKYCLECQPRGTRLDHNKNKIIKVCSNCGKEFIKYGSYSPDRKCCLDCVPINKQRPVPTNCKDCNCELNTETEVVDHQTKHRRSICKKCKQAKHTAGARRAKQKLVDYKGGQCSKCGYNKCLTALEFHHRDSNQKDFDVSRASRTLTNDVKAELDKCDLVCANCHREIHDRFMDN